MAQARNVGLGSTIDVTVIRPLRPDSRCTVTFEDRVGLKLRSAHGRYWFSRSEVTGARALVFTQQVKRQHNVYC